MEVKSSKTKPILITLLVLVVAAAITVGVVLGTRDTSLAKAVSTHSITEHLEELFTIAQTNGANSRAVRLNYNKSAEYVIQKLSEYSGWYALLEAEQQPFRARSPCAMQHRLNAALCRACACRVVYARAVGRFDPAAFLLKHRVLDA